MHDALKRSLVLFLVFAFSFLGVYFFRAWQGGHSIFGNGAREQEGQFVTEHATLASEPPLNENEVPGLARRNLEMTTLVERVTPSVVSISSDMIRSKFIYGPTSARIQHYRVPSLGSGVIVSEEGHVITNHHVIEGYNNIRVILHDDRSLPATLVGSDELLDIAVLRLKGLEGEKFPPLKFADSDQVKVGQLAIAIGNPLGLRESVTVGHISARDRTYSDQGSDMFQTDAAINPGNSGGPLLNHLGEVIAINASIFTDDHNKNPLRGIGFSIPANEVRRSFNYICEKGRPVYGYLGLSGLHNLSDYLRSVFPYAEKGVLVLDIAPDSPADQAGMKANDIIIEYNGKEVTDRQTFLADLGRTLIGSQCTIAVQREDQVIKLNATVGEADAFTSSNYVPAIQRRKDSDNAILKKVGLVVDSTPNSYQRRGIYGVVVTRVASNSLAEREGIQPNDIIRRVNGSQLRGLHDFFFRIVTASTARETKLNILRGNEEMVIFLPKIEPEEPAN